MAVQGVSALQMTCLHNDIVFGEMLQGIKRMKLWVDELFGLLQTGSTFTNRLTSDLLRCILRIETAAQSSMTRARQDT